KFDARESFAIQYRLKRHDGEYRWITDNGVPRYDAREKFLGYVGACIDITDLLAQEKALHEIEERVALAAEAAQLGAWEFDPVTNELWISDKVRELFQFKPGVKITFDEFQRRVHPEDRPAREASLRNAIQTKGS